MPELLTKHKSRPLIDKVGDSAGLHPEKVLAWRKQRFVELGFVPHEADVLAATRIDLHAMEGLLNKGCSHKTAQQILMGTMWSGADPLWIESEDGGYMNVPLLNPFEDDE